MTDLVSIQASKDFHTHTDVKKLLRGRMDGYRGQQFTFQEQAPAVSESEPTPNAGTRHPSFICTPLVLPPQQHGFEDRAAAFHYGMNASLGTPGFEPPVRACGSSGDPLAQQASSIHDAALFNELFVQGREGGSTVRNLTRASAPAKCVSMYERTVRIYKNSIICRRRPKNPFLSCSDLLRTKQRC